MTNIGEYKMLLVSQIFVVYVDSQVSVVRGKVLAGDGSPLIGVRVSVVTQPLYGFTLSRELGLYVCLLLSTVQSVYFFVSCHVIIVNLRMVCRILYVKSEHTGSGVGTGGTCTPS